MDVSAMKRTQETLGRVIRKPPLTEKLLGKPPFRFLHDVITEVIRTTGFMKGLYGESDMKSDNVKEREAKITFLQKAIDVVAMASGEAVPVRPSKIVAGHEPERTNEFLQALAQCCLSKLPSEDAVRRVLAGEKPDAKSVAAPAKTQGKENRDERPSRQRETKKEVEFKEPSGSRERQEKEASSQDRHHRDRDRDKSKDGDKDKGRDRDREREKGRHAARDGERDRERTKDGHRDRDSERRREKETNAEGSKERDGDGARDRERGGERRERGGERKDREERGDHRVAAGSSKDKDRRRDKQRDEEKKDVKSRDREPPTAATLEDARGLEPASEPAEAVDFETGSPARVVRPPTAKGHRRRHRDVVTNDAAAAAADEEAEGAQKEEEKEEGAPVNGEAADAAALPLQRRPPRPSSARPAAPRIRRQESAETHPTERTGSAKAVANVIVEGGRNSDGDDGGDDDEQFVVAESTPAPSDSLDAGPLEATEDNDGEEHGGLVKKILETKKGYGTTRTPPKVVLDGARQKGREAAVRETERLRGAVQALCRSTLPLSKVMDYLQEDLDAMHAELATWTRQRRQHAEALADQHRLTEKALEPLRAELTTLDQQIQEQLEQIGAVKASVHRNDEKIDKMIGSIGAGARA
uniref:TRAF3-interacting protein 1 n=1 Tax=Petromyzon marinus TaxID=7757 RepID=A0AAJ7U8Y0_PETMA|nr:TRAF3-interacting protein 1 isoform X1 [Petromyzon marinus]